MAQSPEDTQLAEAPPEAQHGRLLGKMHRTSQLLDHQRGRYERVCEERDAAVREREDLAVANEQLQARVNELEGQVMDLTDQLAVFRPDASIKVTGPTRNAS